MNQRSVTTHLARQSTATALLLLLLLVGCATRNVSAPGSTTLARTELFFGLSRAHGADVTDAEWQAFVDGVITPRFPTGLTIVPATGQWQTSGTTIHEPARVVILLYEPGFLQSDKIEQIRRAYKVRFRQESVVRADSMEEVSF